MGHGFCSTLLSTEGFSQLKVAAQSGVHCYITNYLRSKKVIYDQLLNWSRRHP